MQLAAVHKQPSWGRKFLLVCMGLTLLAAYLSCAFFPVIDLPFTEAFIALRIGMFVLYLGAAWCVRDVREGPFLWTLLALGFLHFLVLVPLGPSMSDDLYRYIWDGRVQFYGVNSFLYPPSSRQLSFLMEPWFHPFINHADYRTVYPPTSQWLFWLSQVISPGKVWGYKCLMLLFQVATTVTLAVWLRWRKLPMGRLIWFVWCPLLVFETMLDGHLDGFAPFFLMLVLLTAHARRSWLCGIALGAALLVKPLPLFVVPVLLWHLRWKHAARVCLACGLTCFILYLPFLDAGAFLFKALVAYSRHWHFNGPMFVVLGQWMSPATSRSVLNLGIITVACIAPFLRVRLELRILIPIMAYMLMTPTLYPWYMIWLVAWLVMTPRPWLFWLVGAVSCAHLVQVTYTETGIWRLSRWVMLFEFLPFLLLLVVPLGIHLHVLWRQKRALQRFTPKDEQTVMSSMNVDDLHHQIQHLRASLQALEAQIQAPSQDD